MSVYLVPRVTVRPEDDVISWVGGWFSTGQTSMTWERLPPTGPAFAGSLTRPNSFDAAEDHAASLLDVAEQGLTEGCVPASVPAPRLFRSRETRRLNSVSAKSVEELHQELAKASDRWSSVITCRADAR